MNTGNHSKKIYENCSVYSPSGKLMFRCKKKRANWYLKRDLAKEIEVKGETGLCIKLTFEPKGLGNQDKYHKQKLENKCVVCGSDKKLTKHHIVPRMYRRYFPEEIKSNNHYDVVAMCRKCHDEYELKADRLKGYLANKFNLPLTISEPLSSKPEFRLSKLAYSYENYKDFMDDHRIVDVILEMKKYCDNPLSELDYLISLKSNLKSKVKDHGKYVIKNYNPYLFIILWRRHFLKYANPKHMNKYWKVDGGLVSN